MKAKRYHALVELYDREGRLVDTVDTYDPEGVRAAWRGRGHGRTAVIIPID